MKSKYIICGIVGMILFGILLMCNIKFWQVAEHENQSEKNWKKSEAFWIERKEEIGQTETRILQNNSMIANISGTEAENLSLLSIQEGLDIVFAYVGGEESPIIDIELRGKEENGGRLRYVWNEEGHSEHDRVISEQGYLITSDNTVYRSYLFAIDLYDSGRSFIRTELVNYYWVNMQTGEVIEQRWYDDSICQWEFTEEYGTYICEKEPWETADAVHTSVLTMQEVLDTLYDYLEKGVREPHGLTLLRFANGLGYEWSEEDKPYFVFRLENVGYVEVSDERMYAIFKFSVQMYSQGYTKDMEGNECYKYYKGEQNLQFYAIDMNTGEIIERREYGEEGLREYTQEYKERIIQNFSE